MSQKDLASVIVKGKLASHAFILADIEGVSKSDLVRILREIACELEK